MSKGYKNVLFGLLTMVVLCMAALPQTESEFVEPIVIEETLPNSAGDWDARFSCQYLNRPDEQQAECPRTQFFIGLPRRLGAEINVPFTASTNTATGYGLGDVSGSLKYLLLTPNQRRPAIAIALEASFPTAPEGGEEAYGLQPSLAFLQSLGRATFQGNLGYSFAIRRGAGGEGNQMRGGASVAFTIPRERWYLMAEADGAGSELALAPGVKYKLKGDGFVAFAVPIGVTAASPRFGIVVQVQLAIRKAQPEADETGANNRE